MVTTEEKVRDKLVLVCWEVIKSNVATKQHTVAIFRNCEPEFSLEFEGRENVKRRN